MDEAFAEANYRGARALLHDLLHGAQSRRRRFPCAAHRGHCWRAGWRASTVFRSGAPNGAVSEPL